MKIKIRQANKSDAVALSALRYALYYEDNEVTISLKSYSKTAARYFSESLKYGWIHFVAESDGEIIGCMSLHKITMLPRPYKAQKYIGYLTNSYIKPEFRNKKTGSKILTEIIKYTKENSFESVIVWPSDKSVNLYSRSGFSNKTELSEIRF